MISVIVPVYNKKDYLTYAVQSILEQDYTDYEIILVDDGSTDGSSSVCDHYKKEFGRIKVLHQSNKGVSAARNAGIEMAEGEYILFLDADDMLKKECLKECSDFFKEKRADFIQFEMCVLDQGTGEKKEGEVHRLVLSGREALTLFYQRRDITPLICGAIYKRQLFSELRFNETIHLGEDTLCKFNVIKGSERVGLADGRWYLNRMVENTLSRKPIDALDLESVLAAMRIIQQSALGCPEEKRLRNNYLFHRYYAYFNLVILTNRSLTKHPVFSVLMDEMDRLDLDRRDIMILMKDMLFLLYKKNPSAYRLLMKCLKR